MFPSCSSIPGRALILLGVALLASAPRAFAQTSPVAIENLRSGTSDWRLADPATGREIEGYASRVSVNVGADLELFVNTSAVAYAIDVFRLGWYGGLGGRRVLDSVERRGTRQFVPLPDPTTGYLACDWVDPFTLHVPDGSGTEEAWVSGVYVAKLTTRPGGKESYILFVVRDDDRPADMLFQSAVVTFQAVNAWGGRSLRPSNSLGAAATRVSFARPYAAGFRASAAAGLGAGELITNTRSEGNLPVAGWEINMLRWLEREGYDVTYTTSADTHLDPGPLGGRRVLLTAGRDEYWTAEMRQHVSAAVRDGMNFGIFGSGIGDIAVRLDAGNADDTRAMSLELESVDGRATDRDVPEPDAVVTNPAHWALAGTHVRTGTRLPLMGGVLSAGWFGTPLSVGAEVAGATAGRVVALGSRVSGRGLIAGSGASQWSWGLDDFGAPQSRPSARSPIVQQTMTNLMARLVARNTDPRLPTPGAVVARASASSIVVEWRAAASRPDLRYEVYRSMTSDVVPSGVLANDQPQSSSTLIDASVQPGQRYYYAVVAVDASDRASAPSEVVSAVASGAPGGLAPPESLTAERVGSAVRLAWSHRYPSMVAGYRIYRRTDTVGAPWSLLNPSALERRRAFDDQTAGHAYWMYAVAAMGTDGRESVLSNLARVGASGMPASDWIPVDIVATYHLAGAEPSPEFRLESRDPYQAFPGWVFDGQVRYDLPAGETWGGTLWSFPRHGLENEVFTYVRGREIRIGANIVAGGAVAELWWEGRQFLNSWSYGRQLQTALRLDPDDRARPTEGGDQYSAPGPVDLGWVPAGWTHGSPLVEIAATNRTLRTVTAPLAWVPESIAGGAGSVAHPMLWRGAFAKTVELDFEGRPNVIRWRTSVTLPSDAPRVEAEVLGAHLTDDFTLAYDYDADSGVLTPRWVAAATCTSTTPASGAGGTIQTTDDGAFALGLYRRGGQYGISRFDLCNALGGIGGGTYGADTVKSSVREVPPGGLTAGVHDFEVFVVVGTLEQVVRDMQWLYSNGY